MSDDSATRKFGRQARVFRPMLNISSVFGAEKSLPPIPTAVNYGDGMPTDWGMMKNDVLGDCTCAAFYHLLMGWSHNSRHFTVIEPDRDVVALYEAVGGYVPGDPNTDQGAIEQNVLAYLKTVGAPIEPVAGRTTHKILGSAEVDHRNLDDLRRAIYVGGGAYIGFTVPKYLMQHLQHTWDVDPTGDNTVDGGHAIPLIGYDPGGFHAISWGVDYYLTNAFVQRWLDEAYLIADPTWLDATGRTPAHMTKQAFLDYLAQ